MPLHSRSACPLNPSGQSLAREICYPFSLKKFPIVTLAVFVHTALAIRTLGTLAMMAGLSLTGRDDTAAAEKLILRSWGTG